MPYDKPKIIVHTINPSDADTSLLKHIKNLNSGYKENVDYTARTKNPALSPKKLITTSPSKTEFIKEPIEIYIYSKKASANVRLYSRQKHHSQHPISSQPPTTPTDKLDVYATKKIIQAYSHRRPHFPSQNAIMGKSATDHIRESIEKYPCLATHLLKPTKWHWLHRIAFQFGGPNGNNPQIKSNLVAGTASCNSLMRTFETKIREQTLDYEKSLYIETYADLIPDTLIADKIYYSIYDGESYIYITLSPTEIYDNESINPVADKLTNYVLKGFNGEIENIPHQYPHSNTARKQYFLRSSERNPCRKLCFDNL